MRPPLDRPPLELPVGLAAAVEEVEVAEDVVLTAPGSVVACVVVVTVKKLVVASGWVDTMAVLTKVLGVEIAVLGEGVVGVVVVVGSAEAVVGIVEVG